eukprot:CAMPEP_0116127038 /NCGR_PEP_ID=MMETSP0329-20121206/6636_1 /TAXON_ID=697910 /ORGANISM="Pseudo-nitzschia arenysensis, Strain B593" /LENGTH=1215 /DNA_ID=CAMNT_0003621129 /DNA_START=198 /DNA_END=3845 /DNA_ORIENTATION=-
MHIKEVVIDGFKSYARRTVVEGFDPHFNAITGLNGSGKSNILDSICFVLGITNLSQVRAGNLSELVYKQGQAGVTKASVTVIFNNEDEATSPVGYEQCREVTVTRQVLLGGKSKYLINGRNSPAGQVQNLFHSVQLNVNNPHFLIMQGRITKVLNMKPNEILGMVEEAAGTRMYETKRVAAIKTIDKKQAKVDELNAVLSEEITPTLERLRGEKQNYLMWSKNNADIQRIERFVVASDYIRAQQALDSNLEGSNEMEEQVAELEGQVENYTKQIEERDAAAEEISSKLKGEFEESHAELKKEEEKLSKKLVKVTSAWQNSQELTKKAETDLAEAKALVTETKNAYIEKEQQIARDATSVEAIIAAKAEAEQNVEDLSLKFQNMSAGISVSQGDEGMTLPDQIAKAHSDSKTAEAKVKQATMKIKHLTKSLTSVEKQMKKEQKSAETLNKRRDASSAKAEKLQNVLSELNFNQDDYTELDQEKDNLTSSVEELNEIVQTLTAKLGSRLAFDFSDPVRGFDRSKVKGLVAKLIEVQDPVHATALEVVAGGKLYQVVVDEAITGKAILDRGKLRRRVTIIPLDKIQPRRVTSAVCQRASQIASNLGAKAWPAIELVGFDEEVRSAMEYVFGASIVVDGAKAANQICDSTKTRTVTLDGDVYDPSGTITGGSRGNVGSTLVELTKLMEASKQLSTKKERLSIVLTTLDQLKDKYSQFDKLSRKLSLAEAELEGIQKQVSQTSYGVLEEKFESMSAELEEANKEYSVMQLEQKEKWDLYHELKEREEELTQQRENMLGQIEADIKKAKKAAADAAKKAREAESSKQTLTMELESLKADVVSAEEAVSIAEKALQEANEEELGKEIVVGEVKALWDEAKASQTEFENRISQFSSDLAEIKREMNRLAKKSEKCNLESKKLKVEISRIEKERQNAEKVVVNLLKAHPWIESEKSAFGLEGGDYDFTSTNPDEMSVRLKALKSDQDSLSKKINKKVMGMIEKAEGEYTELLRKRKVVENDKRKIKKVIEELDIKKKAELERTWKKVNKDFGSIFSTLLPGASSKLEPPEGMRAWEGLEVKVAFGDVWKESLSELSGGQRSLLALSLILSLLLFKPAPMYILDEVDAALDLSHTQNIGNMLKTHFSQSQFIVVSLKEGMFNNANVIFRTKFVDGVSTVARTIGTGSSTRQRVLADANGMDSEPTGVRKHRSQASKRKKGKENSV